MLWRTSKSENVIEIFIETKTLNQFLNLASVTMTSFRETYSDKLPEAETNEFKFILGLLGIYINVAAQRVGRDFILDREIGIEFVQNALEYLGEIPMPAGTLIRRLILMMLFNINIEKRGSMLIEQGEKGIKSILGCLNMQNTSEIIELALHLLSSLLREIPTKELCGKIINLVGSFITCVIEHLFHHLLLRYQKVILNLF